MTDIVIKGAAPEARGIACFNRRLRKETIIRHFNAVSPGRSAEKQGSSK